MAGLVSSSQQQHQMGLLCGGLGRGDPPETTLSPFPLRCRMPLLWAPSPFSSSGFVLNTLLYGLGRLLSWVQFTTLTQKDQGHFYHHRLFGVKSKVDSLAGGGTP